MIELHLVGQVLLCQIWPDRLPVLLALNPILLRSMAKILCDPDFFWLVEAFGMASWRVVDRKYLKQSRAEFNFA